MADTAEQQMPTATQEVSKIVGMKATGDADFDDVLEKAASMRIRGGTLDDDAKREYGDKLMSAVDFATEHDLLQQRRGDLLAFAIVLFGENSPEANQVRKKLGFK